MTKNKLKKYCVVDASGTGHKKVEVKARNAHDAITKVIEARYKAKTTREQIRGK